MYIFTICSNNYLAQAIVLGNSIKIHNPEYDFKIFLCDEKSKDIDYNEVTQEIIEIGSFYPEIYNLAEKYNIVELNTAVKPMVFEHIFNAYNTEKVIYLDPDIYVYTTLIEIEEQLCSNSILLTPHIFSPIPIDGKTPSENTFLNYGIYNLGFLALKKDDNARQLLTWWKNITSKLCYIKPCQGIFVDQLPMNLVPLYFKGVKVLNDLGYNMAPWNLHERKITWENNVYKVNGIYELKFYHFSSFAVDQGELPLWHYNRFILRDRIDLHEIYAKYNDDLKNANHLNYKSKPCIFVNIRNEVVSKESKLEWQRLSTLKKFLLFIKNYTPVSIKKMFR